MKGLFYPIYGLVVIGVYAALASSGFDPGSTSVTRGVLPPEYRAPGLYQASPAMVWHTGFHGPSRFVPDDDEGGGGVVFFGGYGGGK